VTTDITYDIIMVYDHDYHYDIDMDMKYQYHEYEIGNRNHWLDLNRSLIKLMH